MRRTILHVYSDNEAGMQLYRGKGYFELERDPEWRAALGARIRVTMAKCLTAKRPTAAAAA
jgi:ribosomal protein S18 acetylase RimI-like enzyme